MTLPLGYRYSAAYAGIRKDRRDDLALIVSDAPASAAAVFTRNLVQAAPVKLARKHLKKSRGHVRAVLVNAGNANCAAPNGDRVALETCRAAAKQLKARTEDVFPASTGVIGVELDPALILNALPALFQSLAPHRFEDAARAILTTDTVPKIAAREVRLKSGVFRIAGFTKGAGMIQPNMATTLGFVMTDAAIHPRDLRPMLARATERSYHRISVDGDTSTNDTVLVLANGASGVKQLDPVETALCEVMEDLARQIARDGEGARKLITIEISGAKDNDSAARLARAIANSPLVKTAIAGSDPNWGRILSAAGNAGVSFDPSRTTIALQGVAVCQSGVAASFSEPDLKHKLDTPDCTIHFSIRGRGKGHARFWTCDLTEDYIRINASYRT
jgi:glutamate N-acetyltransferase/amino-acid N-acetyltransferase